MNEKYIKKLIRLVEESEIESLEVSGWGRRIKITQKINAGSNGHSEIAPVIPVQTSVSPAPPKAPEAPAATEPTAPAADNISNLVEIKSPMVGTFYQAPSPDADTYVSLNEKIAAGQVVCIVEAMKLMNEIESEVSGRVVEILAENGRPVEFSQTLFLIDPNG